MASIAWLFDYRYSKSNQNKDLAICEQIILGYGGNYLTHLIYSGDKDYFVHDNESAFLMYRYKSNALVVLGTQLEMPLTLNLFKKHFMNLQNKMIMTKSYINKVSR